ncbi:MAG: dockerin type I repeat-containing protein [Planctomycetota bacterium]
MYADSVLRGTVLSREPSDTLDIFCDIEVDTVWKGPVAPVLRIQTDYFCGSPEMEIGKKYILYSWTETSDFASCELLPYAITIAGCLRSRDDELAEAEALGEPIWSRPVPFLRGDTNDDGGIDISDPVATLNYLFLGRDSPRCRDASDANDDGSVTLSDAIFTLNYLVLGGGIPPSPGPFVPGFDRSVDGESCGDLPLPSSCKDPVERSSLPGVRLEIIDAPCQLTLGEAAAGVVFSYRTVVDAPKDVVTRSLGTCQIPTAAGLYVLPTISGGEQRYCLCDKGFCPPEDGEITLERGARLETLSWCGKNWIGPSDFANPPGRPFPPGLYTFTVRSVGTHQGREFELESSIEIELVE